MSFQSVLHYKKTLSNLYKISSGSLLLETIFCFFNWWIKIVNYSLWCILYVLLIHFVRLTQIPYTRNYYLQLYLKDFTSDMFMSYIFGNKWTSEWFCCLQVQYLRIRLWVCEPAVNKLREWHHQLVKNSDNFILMQ